MADLDCHATWYDDSGETTTAHFCYLAAGHNRDHHCLCGFHGSDYHTTSGTARQSVPDDGPGATPPASGPSSPPDGGVNAPPDPHDPRPDAATSSPTPPSLTADDYVRATAESLGLDADVAVAYRQELPADERARDRLATNPTMQVCAVCGGDRCTATHDAPVLSGPSGSRRESIAPRGRYMDAEEAAECFRTIVGDTDPIRRAMALSSLAAIAGYAVVSPPVVEQLVDVLRALRDRVPTEPEEDHR
jgi:hypothetical protein